MEPEDEEIGKKKYSCSSCPLKASCTSKKKMKTIAKTSPKKKMKSGYKTTKKSNLTKKKEKDNKTK